jgi:hypothetical protein
MPLGGQESANARMKSMSGISHKCIAVWIRSSAVYKQEDSHKKAEQFRIRYVLYLVEAKLSNTKIVIFCWAAYALSMQSVILTWAQNEV